MTYTGCKLNIDYSITCIYNTTIQQNTPSSANLVYHSKMPNDCHNEILWQQDRQTQFENTQHFITINKGLGKIFINKGTWLKHTANGKSSFEFE